MEAEWSASASAAWKDQKRLLLYMPLINFLLVMKRNPSSLELSTALQIPGLRKQILSGAMTLAKPANLLRNHLVSHR